jgi:hypothetical protein
MEFHIYKVVVIGIIALLAGSLAIRIKGKLVLIWLTILLRYRSRPRVYLFNKNSLSYREDYPDVPKETTSLNENAMKDEPTIKKLGFQETAYVFSRLDDPISRLRFETTKKGGLNVRITEAQD